MIARVWTLAAVLAASSAMPADQGGPTYREALDSERTDEGDALRAAAIEKSGSLTRHTSPWLTAVIPFNEALISWNIDLPEGCGYAVAMRFRRENETEPSAWYHLGRFGSHPKIAQSVTDDAGGKVSIDCFTARGLYRSYQYRLSLAGRADGSPEIRRVSVLVSDTTRTLDPDAARKDNAAAASSRAAPLKLDVPFRSQRQEDPRIAGRICSPTSLAMVLAYHGIVRPTADVAARAYDSDHDIYGNWPVNVQAAYSFGLRGKLARFRTWEAARERIAAGQPIVISIRDKEGILQNAPYRRTDGHLLVLRGFDAAGNPLVNDPAAKEEREGVTTYDREQMERVWLDQGGLAYLIEGDPAR